MVQMLFYLRFRSQLRRTRPDLLTKLDEAITGAIFAAGGQLSDNRRFLNASFDSGRIGFWIDMLILIDTVKNALGNAGQELSGHALVINRNIPESDAERLCRSLSSGAAVSHTGIWIGGAVRENLEPYCLFEKPYRGYTELIDGRTRGDTGELFPYREKIIRVLEGSKNENTLLFGSVTGIRDGVHRYCHSVMKEIPPLVISFGDDDCGPVNYCDALTPELRSALAASAKNGIDELESLCGLMFRERLRDQVSPFLLETGKRFFSLLLQSYKNLTAPGIARAPVILENPLKANPCSREIFMDVTDLPVFKNEFLFVAFSGNDSEDQGEWGKVFTRALKLTGKDFPAAGGELPALPADLWEMMYAYFLSKRFFSSALFPKILEEEGLNPGISQKTLQLLLEYGAVDCISDPQPCIPDFFAAAEKMPAERKDKIRAMIRRRLLAWEKDGRLGPCFNFLRILRDLGGEGAIDDPLFLRAMRSDINNGTFDGMENAFSGGQINLYVKKENVSLLAWIFKTQKALVASGYNEIRDAFAEPVPALPVPAQHCFNAQSVSNLCAYRLGCRDTAAAAETVRELLLLNQNLRDGGIPSYRFFSLVNLLKQKTDDTLEYGSFAIDLAEKTGSGEELVKSLFFAASSNFLCGNLSAAGRLILKTEETAAGFGRADWALMSRFLHGRFLLESGHYQESLAAFVSLEGKVPPDAGKMLAAWIYRARIFLQAKSGKKSRKPVEPPDLSVSDGLLFNIEAAYLLGNYEEAVRLADRYLDAPQGNNDFFYTEQPDYRSGFSQCEHMVILPDVLLRRQITVYRLLAQSCLPFTPETGEILQSRIHRLVREELLPDCDPSDIFCLYACYLILRRTGSSHGDIGTAVSLAYRRFQRRLGRIEAMQDRQDFSSLNYWNSALSLAARENKLI